MDWKCKILIATNVTFLFKRCAAYKGNINFGGKIKLYKNISETPSRKECE